ncbi:MAG: flavodoxin/nitric oxide synthase [Chloroflexi bacterium]|nr:flavodoxin/nitric oxide synthase [Chloroflexota bacterium]
MAGGRLRSVGHGPEGRPDPTEPSKQVEYSGHEHQLRVGRDGAQGVEVSVKDEILVAYSTRHESSREIASAIVDILRAARLTVQFEPVEAVGDLRSYGAAVLGCTIYDGTWFPGAEEFLEAHARELSGMAVWLFASGWTEVPPAGPGAEVPGPLVHAVERISPRDVALFAGSHQPLHVGAGIRVMSHLPPIRFSDHRDWNAIERWGRSIRDEVQQTLAAGHEAVPVRIAEWKEPPGE